MSKSDENWPEDCSCGQAHVVAVFPMEEYDEWALPQEVHSFHDCIAANKWIAKMREEGFRGVLEGMSSRRENFPEWLEKYRQRHQS